jgi:hypothetical protein
MTEAFADADFTGVRSRKDSMPAQVDGDVDPDVPCASTAGALGTSGVPDMDQSAQHCVATRALAAGAS